MSRKITSWSSQHAITCNINSGGLFTIPTVYSTLTFPFSSLFHYSANFQSHILTSLSLGVSSLIYQLALSLSPSPHPLSLSTLLYSIHLSIAFILSPLSLSLLVFPLTESFPCFLYRRILSKTAPSTKEKPIQ